MHLFWSCLFGVQMPPVPSWAPFHLDLGNCLIKFLKAFSLPLAQNSFSSVPVIHRTGLSMCLIDLKCSIHTFSSHLFYGIVWALKIFSVFKPVILSSLWLVLLVRHCTGFLFDLMTLLVPVFQFGFCFPLCLLIYWTLFSSSVLTSLFHSIVCSLWNSLWVYLHPLWCLWTYL